MAAVAFDLTGFRALYPEFAGVSDAQLNAYFGQAGLYLANDTCNPAFGAGVMPQLYNMLVAHLTWLFAPRDASGNPATTGASPASLVGRINSATEGSVSVQADMGDANAGSPSQAFYMQTRYGAQFWYATAQFRTARYVARPTIVAGAMLPYGRGRIRGPW